MVLYIQPQNPTNVVNMNSFIIDIPYSRSSEGLINYKPVGVSAVSSEIKWSKPTVVDMAGVTLGYYYYRVTVTPPSTGAQIQPNGLLTVTFPNLEISSIISEGDLLITENPQGQSSIGPLSFSIFKYPQEFSLDKIYFTAQSSAFSDLITTVSPAVPFYINWSIKNPQLYPLTLSWKSRQAPVNGVRVEDRGNGLITYPSIQDHYLSVSQDTVFTLTANLGNSQFVQLTATIGVLN